MRKRIGLAGVAAAIALAMVLLPATPASAHPLGNFSINEYVGLTLHPDRIDARTAVDIAEIPTLQDRPAIDTDHNGQVSTAEAQAAATRMCQDLALAVRAKVGDAVLQWRVGRTDFAYHAGAGGLEVSRLSCDLSAPATVDGRTSLTVDNGFLADRVGWREMTAVGDGVRLINSALPTVSVSDELRQYPADLLSSVLTVRSAVIAIEPGQGASGGAAAPLLGSGGDPFSRLIAHLDRAFADLVGGVHLTVWVGLLAVLLAALLGAGHAALPGHGKTILAAYLAGKRGRPRDALVVASTVTLTHTGGVLVLGLLLTAGTAIAGERILGWLGLLSGIIVVAVGVGMLAGLLRRRAGHRHDHGHDHDHDHGHSHAGHDHEHSHGGHDHRHSHGDHDHGHHDHGHHDHAAHHGHSHVHSGHDDERPPGRRRLGLAGIGIAGGLVPSPSALVVLLGAIGLGRTGFGIILVLAYGIGMAATLTGAGLLLVVMQRRLARVSAGGRFGARVTRLAGRLNRATPMVTAALVVVVGAGLAVRAAAGVL